MEWKIPAEIVRPAFSEGDETYIPQHAISISDTVILRLAQNQGWDPRVTIEGAFLGVTTTNREAIREHVTRNGLGSYLEGHTRTPTMRFFPGLGEWYLEFRHFDMGIGVMESGNKSYLKTIS
jgi:hypothetical protein